jgi:hypothetical protein
MPTKQNPFSIYDSLGYFVPGAVFIYSALFFTFCSLHRASPSSFSTLSTAATWIEYLGKPALLIPFVIASYISGHLLSYLSSRSIEWYSQWTLDFPSQNLFHRIRPNLFTHEKGALTLCLRAAWCIVSIGPLVLLEMPLSFLGFRRLIAKPLDDLTVGALTPRITQFINDLVPLKKLPDKKLGEDRNHFRFLYHHVIEHAPAHGPKLQNYVALYGLTRTMSFVATQLAWVGFYTAHTLAGAISLLVAFSFVALLFYAAFIKFYRRFSLETYMAFAVTR